MSFYVFSCVSLCRIGGWVETGQAHMEVRLVGVVSSVFLTHRHPESFSGLAEMAFTHWAITLAQLLIKNNS